MALKDQFDKLKKFFEEDDDEYDEPVVAAQKPQPQPQKPSAVNTEKKATGMNRPVQPQRQAQAKSTAKRPASFSSTTNNTKTTEKKVQKPMMNQATTNAGQVIAIKEPRAYSDIMESARIVKNGESVLVNFKFMPDNQARRSIDFLTGVVFTLDGDVQNVGGQIFLLTPANITVDASQELSILAGQNFENFDI
ncbi:cell division protein SepF [Lactococcus petauri]|uniref:cell division protein SepF n=1 Tax=Lactococcus petauri TaxID=1940789 RepID=UPI00156EFE2A|nr:cell division protein SepF [Lactococcus petauri]NSL26403.1 cell division protein SepF [Lactococcus petauri]